MSFSIAFSARSVTSARQKLHEAHAPACVKAMIEKALDALPAPQPVPAFSTAYEAKEYEAAKNQARVESHNTASGIVSNAKRAPELIGVFVDVWGHIAEGGDHGRSTFDRFVVQPLFD